MTLPELLARRAAERAGATAYVLLDETGEVQESLTYGELHQRALAVAGRLAARCRPGDRALLLLPHRLDFVVAFFGCLYAGVVAVPVPPPRGTAVPDSTRSIAADSEPAAVLTIAAWRELLGAGTVLALDEPGPDAAPLDHPRPGGLAFLQYTSGSTASPKGVMVTQRNLVANQAMIAEAFGHDERSVVLGWVPFFHDQGLIGTVLQPLWLGTPGVLMAPMTFLRRPLGWLAAIARHGAHTSGGPNFAFDACVARAARSGVPAGLDLSGWQVAFNGAEPVRPETLRAFAAAFAPYGFRAEALYPCYGLAEATLLATGSRKGRGPRTLSADPVALERRRLRPGPGRLLAGSGIDTPGQDLRIVDPETGVECGPGQVGEIWLAGGHVTAGYWRRPAETAATFGAVLRGRSYLRTGDLGTVHEGELYVVGRLKDVVIIRGRNYHPHDIEATVQAAHPAVALATGAAFAVPGPAGERLVVVQEVRQRTAAGGDVAGSIRAAVTREHGLALGDLVLTLPGRLPRTSSGKIRRASARQRYLGQGYDIWEDPTFERMGDVDAPNPDFAQLVPAVVLSMPAAKHLGFDFSRVEPGEVEIVQPYREELTQHNGFVQGGVLGALADFAGGSAAGTLLPAGWINMTIDYTVKILAPAKGDRVVARGRVVKASQTITVAAADVFTVTGDDERLCATALITMRNVKVG